MGLLPRTWYRVSLQVRESRIEAWIDDRKVINVGTQDQTFPPAPGGDSPCLTLHSLATSFAVRNITVRPAGK